MTSRSPSDFVFSALAFATLTMPVFAQSGQNNQYLRQEAIDAATHATTMFEELQHTPGFAADQSGVNYHFSLPAVPDTTAAVNRVKANAGTQQGMMNYQKLMGYLQQIQADTQRIAQDETMFSQWYADGQISNVIGQANIYLNAEKYNEAIAGYMKAQELTSGCMQALNDAELKGADRVRIATLINSSF